MPWRNNGPGHREGKQQYDQASQKEQQELFQSQATTSDQDRLREELHGRPVDTTNLSMPAQMNEDRHDQRGGRDESKAVEQCHVSFLP